MADNDRQRRNYRSSNQDWGSGNYGNQDNWDRGSNYGSEGNRDWGYSGNSSRYNRQNENDYGNSYNQNQGFNRQNSGRYDRDYDSGDMNYGNQHFGEEEQNWGYGGREYGSNYGGGNYQGNSSYYGSGSQGSNRPSFGSSRNLYDRDYEGYNRGMSNRRIGGSNYGNQSGKFSDNDRNQGRSSGSNYGGYSGSNYGGNFLDRDQRKGYGSGDSDERSWWDRTRDEVSSWFGDDDAERRREYDRQQSYRGKGPKNYSRSDDRIKEDINDRLSDDPWIDATEIDVSVTNGEVVLTGTVSERGEKRRAEDVAEMVSGVKHVENRLRVGRREESNIGTGSSIGTGTFGSTMSPGSYGAESSATRTGVTGSTSAVPAGKVK